MISKNLKKHFRNKRVTVMGLGLLGRAVGDVATLAESGANLIVTDLKTKAQLKESLNKLKKYKNPEGKQASYGAGIKYVLGKHRLEDFRNRDFILKTASVPLDSVYIKEAKKNHIPVEMSAALFARLSGLPIVGVTGTRGKSTVTHLIHHILKSAGKKARPTERSFGRAILGGNVRGVSNLQLLKKAQGKEIAIMELDSWQLQGFGEAKISPNISVFTNFMQDHLNYYKNNPEQYFIDKSYIYKFQKPGDVLIVGPAMKNKIKNVKSQLINANVKNIPKSWEIPLFGKHNLENIACAIEAARFLKIKEKIIQKAVENFKAISGRLEFVRSVKGIKIYNDNSSTTPEATIAALKAVGDTKKRKVVLIMGGDNKFLDMSKLVAEIPKWCSKVVLFKERGTDIIKDEVFKLSKKGIEVYEEEGLSNTVKRAFGVAKKGETILYSPAFSSFGKYFANEYDRGDQFMKLVQNPE